MITHSETFDLSSAPMRIGQVRLKVRDLGKVVAFYRSALGLNQLSESANAVTLGTVTTPLLELVGDPSLTPRNPRDAGLFHTAFLLPSRADLGRWLGFVTESRMPLQGASDHIVSEAIYLADPEGNGIEVYVDRPVSHWRTPDGSIHMATEALDADDLLKSVQGTAWSGIPDDSVVGHVNLQVGDTAEAERFYQDVLGFDVASRYPGASFFGSGGYHHQLAGNVWNSRRAGPRPKNAVGLDAVEIIVKDAKFRDVILERAQKAGIAHSTEKKGTATLHDPWGTAIKLAA